MCSSARLAITSLAFMLVEVPAPPWITSTTNWSCSAPPMISSQATMIAPARWRSITPSSALASAAALFAQEGPQRLRARLRVAGHLRARAIDANFHRELATAGRRGAHEALALQLLLRRAAGQEREAMAFERHRLQSLGHVGFVDRVEVQ